jgi:hypothetical protein
MAVLHLEQVEDLLQQIAVDTGHFHLLDLDDFSLFQGNLKSTLSFRQR